MRDVQGCCSCWGLPQGYCDAAAACHGKEGGMAAVPCLSESGRVGYRMQPYNVCLNSPHLHTNGNIANFPSCRCGAQFCYNCGQPWKTCNCPQWHVVRLLARAEQVVARQQPPGADPALVADQVAVVARRLRQRHNCARHWWISTSGQHVCEGCRETLHEFIFRCEDCHLQLCKRCRLNREGW
jgi:hypothetical protein